MCFTTLLVIIGGVLLAANCERLSQSQNTIETLTSCLQARQRELRDIIAELEASEEVKFVTKESPNVMLVPVLTHEDHALQYGTENNVLLYCNMFTHLFENNRVSVQSYLDDDNYEPFQPYLDGSVGNYPKHRRAHRQRA